MNIFAIFESISLNNDVILNHYVINFNFNSYFDYLFRPPSAVRCPRRYFTESLSRGSITLREFPVMKARYSILFPRENKQLVFSTR